MIVPEKDKARDKGYQKAARFLMLLGKDEAAQVMKHLTEEEVMGISEEIASLEKLDDREAVKILEEFGYLMKTKDLVARGGIQMARKILLQAFDENRAGSIIEKIMARTAPHPFSFLLDLDIEQVRLLLKKESAAVIAVILPHLSPERAAAVLKSYPLDIQKNIVARIAHLDKIDPEVLRRAEGVLKEKIRAQGRIITQEVDGPSVLTEIMKFMDRSAEQNILDELKADDPVLGADLENRLFTLDVLFRIPAQDLQSLLREYSETELAFMLKGLDDRQTERVRQSLSERRWRLIREEADAQGAVFRSEIDKAIRDFLDYVKLQAEKGEISILKDEEEIVS